MSANPFTKDTNSYKDFETLKDLKWHCAKCELVSAQAKTWQIWRQKGFEFDKSSNGQYYEKQYCENCKQNTVHRRLTSLKPNIQSKERSNFPEKLKERIKKHYGNIEVVTLRKLDSNLLEIDHRFPQIRWGDKEPENNPDMSEKDIEKKYMLLTRENNLLKSRYCEHCFKTGERGMLHGIEFFYDGTKYWDKSISQNDERGCEGCFWYNPDKWRQSLNKKLKGQKDLINTNH